MLFDGFKSGTGVVASEIFLWVVATEEDLKDFLLLLRALGETVDIGGKHFE